MKVSTLAQPQATGRGQEAGSGVDCESDLAYDDQDWNNRSLAGVRVKVRKRNLRSPGLIRNIDASALAAVVFFLLFVHDVDANSTLPGAGRLAEGVASHLHARCPARRCRDFLDLCDGTVYFGKDKTRPGDLPAQIREGVSGGAEKKIYIQADAPRYGTVTAVLDGVRSAGVEKIAFLVDQRRSVSSSL